MRKFGRYDEFLNDDQNPSGNTYASKQSSTTTRIDQVESIGTEVSYGCVNCRNCQDCKNSKKIENISIQEEVEHSIIDKRIIVDLTKGCTIAKLPFLCDHIQRLASNKHIAQKIYFGQLKKLNNSPTD